jgi:CRISPR type III-A-associated protein Csm2
MNDNNSRSGNRGHSNSPRSDSGYSDTKPKSFDKLILTEGVKDVKEIQNWGHFLADGKDGVKTSQLRKFFGAVKKIQADFENSKGEIVLLNPKLAYAVGRNRSSKIKELYQLLSPLIDDIKEDKKKFKNFVNVFEAIVAYHKEIARE